MTDYIRGKELIVFPKPQRIKDPKYLKWIAIKPCLLEDEHKCIGDTVPCHLEASGMGTKCADYKSVPLCYEGHQGDEGLDKIGLGNFENKYKLDLKHIAFEYLLQYISEGNRICQK